MVQSSSRASKQWKAGSYAYRAARLTIPIGIAWRSALKTFERGLNKRASWTHGQRNFREPLKHLHGFELSMINQVLLLFVVIPNEVNCANDRFGRSQCFQQQASALYGPMGCLLRERACNAAIRGP